MALIYQTAGGPPPPPHVCVQVVWGSDMDAGRLEQQVANVERGIAFLKQEHLAMLAGLQLEITQLKRRCHGQSARGLHHSTTGSICKENRSGVLFSF